MGATEIEVATAREQTRLAFTDLVGANLVPDLSYITAELLDLYAGATDKREDCSPTAAGIEELELGTLGDYPCYIGHSPVHVSGSTWRYQNNNTSDGCDTAAHLCTSGQVWQANFAHVITDRHCANGLKGVLGWKPGTSP